MKLIVGLGNPGLRYANTRHNAGFVVLKALAKKYGKGFKREANTFSFITTAEITGYRTILALPLTYMNLCGNAVRALVKKHGVAFEDLLIVCDDIDLELGRIKIRPKGSSGGHNGLKSIIETLGSNEFARLRIGINRPQTSGHNVSDFVLSAFSKKENIHLKEVVAKAIDCIEAWSGDGINKTMNLFNNGSQNEEV